MKSLVILLAGVGIWSFGLIWPDMLSWLFSWPALVILLTGWSLSEVVFELGARRSGRRPTNGQDGSGPQQPSTPLPAVQTR